MAAARSRAARHVSPEEIAPFTEESGMINEFKLMWHMRHRFPQH